MLYALQLLFNCDLPAQNVRGYIERDNPDDLSPCSILIHPFYFSSWKPNKNSGMEFGCIIHAGKFLDIDISASMAYSESNRKKNDNPRSFAPFNNESLVFGLNVGNIYSSRSWDLQYHGNTVLSGVELKRRTAVALRFGMNHQASTVWTTDLDGVFVRDSIGDTLSLMDRTYAGALNYTLGFSIKSMYSALVVADGERLRRGKWVEVYADAVMNISTNFAVHYQYSDTGAVVLRSKKGVGYRIGCKFVDPSRTNFTFGFEFGVHPGAFYYNGQSYFMIKMGFAITENAKRM